LQKMRTQAVEVGAELIYDRVKIYPEAEGFEIRGSKTKVRAQNVIIATGITDVDPSISNLRELRAKGLIRYCPVCDAYEYRDKKIVTLVCDDHGLKASLFLWRYSKDLKIVASSKYKAGVKILALIEQRGIEVIYEDISSVDSVGEKALKINLENGRALEADVLYPALGFKVNDDSFGHIPELKRADNGCLIVERRQRLQIPGMYAIGDCVDGLSQIAVAAGQAAIAATALHTDIRNLGYGIEIKHLEKTEQLSI
jgi:thioredoxin reductase (NADPH)